MKNEKESLGDRIKAYEKDCAIVLKEGMPVIIRLDGKGFSKYTKDLTKPYSEDLSKVMGLTAIELCKQIQGVRLAYTQSDEINLVLKYYKKEDSEPWFGNQLQKMVSISAAIASTTFTINSGKIWKGELKPATFDSRAFIVPEKDVINAILWRQLDATRNSIQGLARSMYSHKECTDKNINELEAMCAAKGRNWHDEPTWFKRGFCVFRESYVGLNPKNPEVPVIRHRWAEFRSIPNISLSPGYIGKHLK